MKHDLDYMLQVMQAAKEGKEIQYREGFNGIWLFVNIGTCDWDWSKYDYRIKPEEPKPEYAPYENADEFLQAQIIHGPYLNSCTKESPRLILPLKIDNTGIETFKGTLLYNEMCDKNSMLYHIWQDGTPCGKLKQ